MALTDLIAGLAFVSGHIGLARLDRGLRDGIAIPTEELQAHVTLLSRSAQIVMVTNQIQQLQRQASSALKQQLNAQHALLMVQVGQLQMQLQQLHTERQRLELEEKKELRLAQENRVMRIFVDLYEQAQTYRLQGQVLDFVVVALASFRLYRQIYNDLDDANNRLRLSDLRERLFTTVSETLRDHNSREALAEAYARTMQQPLHVLAGGQQAKTQAITLLNTEHGKAEAANASWGEAASSAAIGIDRLQQARQALVTARQELGRLLSAQDLREYFFPLQQDQSGGLLVGLASEWQAWVATIEARAGQRLADVYRALDQLPGELDQTLKQAEAAVGQSQQQQLTYQLAEALSRLGTALPAQRTLYQELNEQYQLLRLVHAGAGAETLLDGLYELQQIQANLIDSFGPLQRYLDQNRYWADTRYQAEASRRLESLGGESKASMVNWLWPALGLYTDVGKLNQAISASIAVYWRQLRKTAATDEGFAQLRARAAQLADEAQLREVDRLTLLPTTHLTERVLQGIGTRRKRQADQHWRWVEHFVHILSPAAARVSNGTRLPGLLPLPPLVAGASGKPVAPFSPAALTTKRTPWLALALIAAVLMACVVVCAISLVVSSPSASGAVEAAATRRAKMSETVAATLPLVGSPTPGVESTNTAAPLIISSATSESTPTATPTRTLDPSVTPPTATRTAKPTHTPTVTRTATSTRTLPKTMTPTPTGTPAPNVVALLRSVYAGVKLYYGLGSPKAYGVQVEAAPTIVPLCPVGEAFEYLMKA
jgi:hypothetical protein